MFKLYTCKHFQYLSNLQVDLAFPRKPEQIDFLASTVFGPQLEVLKITGFHNFYEDVFQDEAEPQTLSLAVLNKIKASCPGLKTLVFRKCRFDKEPAVQDNLPGTLETLEFHACRYTNLLNFIIPQMCNSFSEFWSSMQYPLSE